MRLPLNIFIIVFRSTKMTLLRVSNLRRLNSLVKIFSLSVIPSEILVGSSRASRCRPTKSSSERHPSVRVSYLSAALLQAVTWGLQVGLFSPGLFTLTEKQPLPSGSPHQADDSSEGLSAVSLTQGQRQWLQVSQKTRWTVSQSACGEKKETAATFGRVMSSVARQPGENIEDVACFYRIFLSLSLSGEQGTLAFPPKLHPFHHPRLSLLASRDVRSCLKGQFPSLSSWILNGLK